MELHYRIDFALFRVLTLLSTNMADLENNTAPAAENAPTDFIRDIVREDLA